MGFLKKLPVWSKKGVEPPNSKKTVGWQEDERPPAEYMNWFQNTTYEAVDELQKNAVHKDDFNQKTNELTTQLAEKATLVEQINTDSLNYAREQCQSIRNQNSSNNVYRIATFNTLFSSSLNNYYLQKNLQTIIKSGANFCGTQESFNGAMFSYDKKMKSDLFTYTAFGQTVFKYYQGYNYGVGLLSDRQITSSNETLYNMNGTTYEQRGYLRNLITLNGIDIALYVTHLSYENTSLVQSQINEVLTAMQNDGITHKILIGDFNTDNLSLLTPFTNAGYTINNDGTFKTFKPTSKAIDNIITSSNIAIVGRGMIDSGIGSDHNLLYVDLKLL